jgi:hypothetical protein
MVRVLVARAIFLCRALALIPLGGIVIEYAKRGAHRK